MTRIKNGMQTLRYIPQASIQVPAEIKLYGDRIEWDITYDCEPYHDLPDYESFVEVGTKNCLRDFVRLADASPEKVLEFTRAHGVLGIEPVVEIQESDPQQDVPTAMFRPRTVFYSEPVFYYTRLASQANSLLKAMALLKSGKPVPSTLHPGQWGTFWSEEIKGTLSPLKIHSMLKTAAEMWWLSSQCRFDLSQNKEIGEESFVLNFGLAWGLTLKDMLHDFDVSLQCLPEGIGYRSDTPYPKPGEYFSRHQSGIDLGFDKTFSYAEHEEQVADQFPIKPERCRSPLYNVLAFQLLQQITLPDGTYFCDQCGEMFEWIPGERNKPRHDRAVLCGKSLCKLEQKRKIDRQSKASTKHGNQEIDKEEAV